MTLATIQVTVELTEINCGECGGTYAINERYRLQQYQKGGVWTCPYCKTSWGYSNNNENAKLKAQVERLTKQKEWAEQESRNAEARARAAKGQVTKLKNRASRGVCPCCTRSFTNLRRHMETKHPEFATQESA